jgi:hypothetical protein
VRALLIIAGVQFLLMTGAQVGNGFRLRDLRDRAAQADQAAARGEKLSLEQSCTLLFNSVEWGWRSLTYWQRQPMRVRHEHPAAEAVAAYHS